MDNKCHGYFAGIGSRDTPEKYLKILETTSRAIVKTNRLRLRSGHAQGADRACEIGAKGFADIYLPWKNYGIKSYKTDPGMQVIGQTIIPAKNSYPNMIKIAQFMCDLVGRKSFDEMNHGIQLLMQRNVNQIIGHTAPAEISRLVLCYSPETGGTGYATALARYLKVPIVNVLGKDLETVRIELDETMPFSSRFSPERIKLLKGIYE